MSGMTITEKILAAHADRQIVQPGEIIWVRADRLMTHDVCGPATIAIFEREFGSGSQVWDPDRLLLIPDHFIFTQDQPARQSIQALRTFAKKHQIRAFHDVGTDRYCGVCHVTMAEQGYTRPGEVVFGTDSHTCTAGAFGLFATGIGNTDAAFVMGTGKLWLRVPQTMRVCFEGPMPTYLMAKDLILEVLRRIGVEGACYQAMEFAGSTVSELSMPERMTLCNMAIEAGGKNGIIAVDDVCRRFLRPLGLDSAPAIENDPDAGFAAQHQIPVQEMVPMVAKPHSPGNVVPVTQLQNTKIDQCYLGSCTGGKTEDFLRASQIFNHHRVKVPTFAVPATQSVVQDLKQLQIEGRSIVQILESAGVQIGPPSCAACLGGPDDTFGRLKGNQVCISATNRNFPGRMGSPSSSVFLASPLTVAASALTGSITDPRNYLE